MLVRLGQGLAALRRARLSTLPAALIDERGEYLLAAQDGRPLSLEWVP
ncbi:hypothetical protein N825_34860 [Skermanella stibiiresistens SB22]|uniref:Uncharacterized protein n=1 Tax=Skermanella stibiiresistens SB22 TaxID=1385369 RepID=W9H7K2_9PROT|nr:hypothetical protein [Skermanella stibiiresistens]EWY40652.1 hypothetical protein N825_34860 [Skermanella stibiiresistens SB22]